MTKTIEQLWNGGLSPVVTLGRKNAEIRELERLMLTNLDRLEPLLSKEAAEHLEKYTDCCGEYISLLNMQAFCDGFCLGTKITTEALHGAEDIMP